MVHPVRALLAFGGAGIAAISIVLPPRPAFASGRRHAGSGVRIGSGSFVPPGTFAGIRKEKVLVTGKDPKMKISEMIFTGIKGSVIALDRATGKQVWVARLMSYDFVAVMVDEGKVYAACCGEVFCLDPEMGDVLWHNGLKGFGTGIVSLATATAQSTESPMLAQKRRRDQQAAAAAS